MDDAAHATAEEKQRLAELRLGLLRLHKALLDVERQRYEREHGRVPDGFALFNLVSNDAAFAWLRPMTTLIVQLDEKLDAKEPLTATEARLMREEARALIRPDPAGDEFQRNYDRAVQSSPDVLILHTRAERLL